MKKIINLLTILGLGLFVSVGHAQMKGMDQKQQSDSTHHKERHDHGSMKMENHESMKMGHKMKKEMDKEKFAYYTCPMESHKHFQSSEPGDCPKCGMRMVKAVLTDEKEADYYGCPMPSHSHVRSDKLGKCKECGMELKPMKLKKS